MIVEADPVFCQNLVNRLSGEQRRILYTDRIAGARKIARRRKIDVMIVGLTALKEEGLEIIRVIKKTCPLTEVITINGSGKVALSIEAMKLGAFDDFMGPFTIDSLLARIHDAWQQKKQREGKKKPLLQRYLDVMAAGAFAEAGDHETAIKIMNNKSPGIGPKRRKKNETDQNSFGG